MKGVFNDVKSINRLEVATKLGCYSLFAGNWKVSEKVHLIRTFDHTVNVG